MLVISLSWRSFLLLILRQKSPRTKGYDYERAAPAAECIKAKDLRLTGQEATRRKHFYVKNLAAIPERAAKGGL